MFDFKPIISYCRSGYGLSKDYNPEPEDDAWPEVAYPTGLKHISEPHPFGCAKCVIYGITGLPGLVFILCI
ncbi:MAG: hypothetical protein P4L50_16455, partial [Anaerolineaceae bacterium]|nr:hypothetical protein [Anaerolineaceae bacterium]